jgi:glycosyltransferase involved in cell wall biosynthesis
MRLVVVFLGKRGAGVRLIEIFQKYGDGYLEGQLEFLISSRCATEFPEIAANSYVIKTFEDWRHLGLFPWIIANQVYNLYKICKKQRKKFLFLLPSPSDYFIIKILKYLRFDLTFMIHDLQSHSGEKWPKKSSIKLRLKAATKVITLSQYINDKLDFVAKEKSYMIKHPTFPIKLGEFQPSQSSFTSNYMLSIGRIREYKGIDVLIKAHSTIRGAPLLVIAGEGHIQETVPSNIHLINKWLKDEEIELLIAGASLVIFPYRDATQSGLIPLCRLFEKPLIVSDSGALAEQSNGSNWLWVFQSGDILALSECIRAALGSLDSFHLPQSLTITEEITQRSISSSRAFVKQVMETIFAPAR